MSSKRRGLGRGLGALIPGAETPSGLVQVNITDITTNPRQPRHEIGAETLRELADSVAEHGLLQPLIVTARDVATGEGGPHYQLVAGERRWRAAKLAGLQTVPVLVKEATPQETLELARDGKLEIRQMAAFEEIYVRDRIAPTAEAMS